MLLDEDRMQGRVKVVTVADARGLDRGEGVEHRARSKRHAGFAQGASEVNDVLREQASALRLGFGNARSFKPSSFALSRGPRYPVSSRRSSARVSSISICAFAPSILAMSS